MQAKKHQQQMGGKDILLHLNRGFMQIATPSVLHMRMSGCPMPAQVFPQLYLPVMAEANLRAIRPWRQYLPTPSFFAFLWRMHQLNSYIRALLRNRWNTRHERAKAAKRDILDRLITAIEVRRCLTGGSHCCGES